MFSVKPQAKKSKKPQKQTVQQPYNVQQWAAGASSMSQYFGRVAIDPVAIAAQRVVRPPIDPWSHLAPHYHRPSAPEPWNQMTTPHRMLSSASPPPSHHPPPLLSSGQPASTAIGSRSGAKGRSGPTSTLQQSCDRRRSYHARSRSTRQNRRRFTVIDETADSALLPREHRHHQDDEEEEGSFSTAEDDAVAEPERPRLPSSPTRSKLPSTPTRSRLPSSPTRSRLPSTSVKPRPPSTVPKPKPPAPHHHPAHPAHSAHPPHHHPSPAPHSPAPTSPPPPPAMPKLASISSLNSTSSEAGAETQPMTALSPTPRASTPSEKTTDSHDGKADDEAFPLSHGDLDRLLGLPGQSHKDDKAEKSIQESEEELLAREMLSLPASFVRNLISLQMTTVATLFTDTTISKFVARLSGSSGNIHRPSQHPRLLSHATLPKTSSSQRPPPISTITDESGELDLESTEVTDQAYSSSNSSSGETGISIWRKMLGRRVGRRASIDTTNPTRSMAAASLPAVSAAGLTRIGSTRYPRKERLVVQRDGNLAITTVLENKRESVTESDDSFDNGFMQKQLADRSGSTSAQTSVKQRLAQQLSNEQENVGSQDETSSLSRKGTLRLGGRTLSVAATGEPLSMSPTPSEGSTLAIDRDSKQIILDNRQLELLDAEQLGGAQTCCQRMGRKCQRVNSRSIVNFMKKTITFLFSQIGLSIMVVAYCFMGGVIFQKIERDYELELIKEQKDYVIQELDVSIQQLWNITKVLNILDEEAWQWQSKEVMITFIDKLHASYRKRPDWRLIKINATKDETEEDIQWSLPGALLFAVTVITTIGYGHITPKTQTGRMVCIAYALFGMPLMFLCLANIGNFFGSIFRLTWRACNTPMCKSKQEKSNSSTSGDERVLVTSASGHPRIASTVGKPRSSRMAPIQDYGEDEEMYMLDSTINSKVGPELAEKLQQLQQENQQFTIQLAVPDAQSISRGKEKPRLDSVRVPISLCLLVVVSYIMGGALIFTFWEGWRFLDGAYFCFVTLSTIGFGDFVPGTAAHDDKEKLIVLALWLLIGLSIISMCLGLVQEEVKNKVRSFGQKIGIIDRDDV